MTFFSLTVSKSDQHFVAHALGPFILQLYNCCMEVDRQDLLTMSLKGQEAKF